MGNCWWKLSEKGFFVVSDDSTCKRNIVASIGFNFIENDRSLKIADWQLRFRFYFAISRKLFRILPNLSSFAAKARNFVESLFDQFYDHAKSSKLKFSLHLFHRLLIDAQSSFQTLNISFKPISTRVRLQSIMTSFQRLFIAHQSLF